MFFYLFNFRITLLALWKNSQETARLIVNFRAKVKLIPMATPYLSYCVLGLRRIGRVNFDSSWR